MGIVIRIVFSLTLVAKIKVHLFTSISFIGAGVFQRALEIPVVVFVLLRIFYNLLWYLYRIEQMKMIFVSYIHTRTLLQESLPSSWRPRVPVMRALGC
jgi:hypothetical protein